MPSRQDYTRTPEQINLDDRCMWVLRNATKPSSRRLAASLLTYLIDRGRLTERQVAVLDAVTLEAKAQPSGSVVVAFPRSAAASGEVLE